MPDTPRQTGLNPHGKNMHQRKGKRLHIASIACLPDETGRDSTTENLHLRERIPYSYVPLFLLLSNFFFAFAIWDLHGGDQHSVEGGICENKYKIFAPRATPYGERLLGGFLSIPGAFFDLETEDEN